MGRGENDGRSVAVVAAAAITVRGALVHHWRRSGGVRHGCGVHSRVVVLAGKNGAHRRSGVVRPRNRVGGGE